MIWPFRRRPRQKNSSPVRDRRTMNEDWRAGDLACCISNSFYRPSQHNPNVGDVLRVTRVVEGFALDARVRLYGLQFESKPGNMAWDVTAFRKLRPTLRAADASFSRWLRDTLRPGKTVAPVREDAPVDACVDAPGREVGTA